MMFTGERLKDLRLSFGFTQQQVADYLNMDQSNYSKIEKGKRNLTKLSMVLKLCELYGCTQDYILCRSDEYHGSVFSGIDLTLDLNIIAQLNITMKYLKMLREIENIERLKSLNEEYISIMEKHKLDYIDDYHMTGA